VGTVHERVRWVVLVVAVVLGALVTAGCLATSGMPARQLSVLFVVPVALCGLACGARGALVAVPLGIGLLVATTVGDGNGLVGYLAESAAVVTAGGVSGLLESWRTRERASVPDVVESDESDTRWFETANELLAEASLDGYFTRLSAQWEACLGWTRAELMARPMLDFVHPDDREATQAHADRLERSPADVVDFENRYLAKDGSWHWLLWSSRSDEHRKYAVAKDITARKALEQDRQALLAHLEEIAQTDALTNLPNRRAWDEELVRAVARSCRIDEPLALAMVDVDDFKSFNDTFGHAAGDGFLAEAARCWRASLRVTDFLARYGGEEFAVLLPGCTCEQASALAERLRSETPGLLTCSIGVALFDGAEDPDSLVRRADAALYDAKRLGRDRVVTARPRSVPPA